MIVEGDISNLAGRMPLGMSPEPSEPGPTETVRTRGRCWTPLWALVFVFGAGLLSWSAIAAIIVAVAGYVSAHSNEFVFLRQRKGNFENVPNA